MQILQQLKRSFVTRNVELDDVADVLECPPQEGDLLIARVDRIRQHSRLENCQGRRVHLFPGDEIIVVAGARYATDQFFASPPSVLGKTNLVAAGGIAADVISKSAQVKPATEITLKGVLADQTGLPVNLKNYTPLSDLYLHPAVDDLPVLLVAGSDMNSGKTSVAAAVIRGMTCAGFKTAGAKLTGTGSGPDYWKMLDAGACQVRDFIDAGVPSTAALSESRILKIFQNIKLDAQQAGADVLIIELADGVLQPQNRKLLENKAFTSGITSTMLAADSSTAAVYCIEKLIEAGMPVYGLGGLVTQSELSVSEITDTLGLPCYSLNALREVGFAKGLMASLDRELGHVTGLAI